MTNDEGDRRFRHSSFVIRHSSFISPPHMPTLNIDSIKELTYDAIVIGSGVSGGWAAKELTEKGLRVLMLERGRQLEHVKDYENAFKAPWELKYNGKLTTEQIESHPKVSRDYPYNEMTEKYWFKDADSLYREEKRFDWFRPNIVGGKSIMWGRQSYRWSDFDFEANLREGIAVDWPIRYADIAPWYSYVEEFAGISGQAEGLPQLPDGKFLPPMEMTCVELDLKAALAKNFDDRMMTIGRSAVLTRVHKGRAACHYCGVCHRGCITNSYFSSISSTLPAAQKTGRLTMRPYSVVHSLIFDSKARRVSGVRVIDAQSKSALEFKARIFFI